MEYEGHWRFTNCCLGSGEMTKILMLTTVHNAKDHRIYWKETRSLEKAGYEVEILAPVKVSIKRHVLNVAKIFMKATFTDADIVHCHEPSSLLIGAILKPFKRYKLIYDVHEFYPELVALRMGRGLLKSSIIFAENTFEKVVTFCFVDGVISVNRDIRKKFNFLCMNHVIIENYPSANQFYNAGSDEELVYIGTLTEERGILQMVQAFKLVNRGKLTIVGKFWNASYEKKVMEAINGANVNFIGSVPYPDVPTYVAHARAGLCVLNDSERHKNCIPSKFLELMLASKPMIVTDIWDGFIRESGAGFTVKYGDIEDLAACMLEMFKHPDRSTQIGKAGHDYAIANNMTWEAKEKELLKFYKGICK